MKTLAWSAAIVMALCISSVGQSTMGKANPAEKGQTTEITGCLHGSSQQYRLVETNGTTHMLIGENRDLGSHVGDMVTLQGYRDNNRDASASGNNGMMNGQRFFQVTSIAADTGKCK